MALLSRIADRPRVVGILLVFGSLLLSGCSNSRRQSIEGTVTMDGQPMPKGSIKFLPEKGTLGPTAGASIENGRFSIDASKSTFAGKFRVEILANRPSGRTAVDPMTGEKYPVPEQYVPARYNSQSELTIDIAEGQPNRLEFDLVSK